MLDFSVTLIITIINLTILFFILKAILFKPVTKFMAERAQKVQNSIDQAEQDKAESQKLLIEYKDKLKKAETEATEILKTAHSNAERLAESIIAEGKEEAANITASARKQIEKERQAALAKFKLEAAALIIAASAKLSSRDFSGEENRRYANMMLEELGQHIIGNEQSAAKGRV
ncbi:MAG: F0F1 ATP synthase subunit B [Treponema sp.]|jgi:F-type H+-transporting ATPase subunit b|nr:F0F1 ATP synthase subunit B [Treponema sp.]